MRENRKKGWGKPTKTLGVKKYCIQNSQDPIKVYIKETRTHPI